MKLLKTLFHIIMGSALMFFAISLISFSDLFILAGLFEINMDCGNSGNISTCTADIFSIVVICAITVILGILGWKILSNAGKISRNEAVEAVKILYPNS